MMSMVFLITIAGGSGSGKTTAAKKIVDVSRKNVLLISLDNYYKDLSYLPSKLRNKTNFDHPDALDWPLLRKQISELVAGRAVRMPCYSFVTHTRTKYSAVKSRPIIVLEGIFALYDAQINKMSDLRLFVDTNSDIRFIRRLERDVNERGRTHSEVATQWVKQVKLMYDKFIEPTKHNAHVILPEDPEGQMRGKAIDLVKAKIKNVLKSRRAK